jgi:hypothetical protein
MTQRWRATGLLQSQTRLGYCGVTRLYEPLAAGAIRSYKDGNNRRVYLTSVQEYQEGKTARGPALGIAPSPRARARAKAAKA